MKAVLRLLVLLTKRDLKGIFSVGINNLFFCALFLIQGSTPGHAFLNTLPFQLLLIFPLFFAMSADALERVPAEREKLWPLAAWQRLPVQIASLVLNPAFWLVGVGGGVWGGASCWSVLFRSGSDDPAYCMYGVLRAEKAFRPAADAMGAEAAG